MKSLYLVLALALVAGNVMAGPAASDNVDTLKIKSCEERGFDKGDQPNEAGSVISEKLKDEATSKEEILSYFTHYSPIIRHSAALAMVRYGEEAMPLLIECLQSDNKYKIRAACDTISQFRGFFGVNVHKKASSRDPYVMTPEINAPAAPYLGRLLDHKDMNVQMGALQALGCCGKAAAPYLGKAVTFLKSDEQWLRSSAAYVIQGVGSPEADKYLPALVEAMSTEIHVQALNCMSGALKDVINTCSNEEEMLAQVGKDLEGMFHPFHRSRSTAVLAAAGPDAKVALPYIDELIKKLEKTIAEAEANGTKLKNAEEWDLNDLTKTREKIMAEPKGKK